MKKLLASIVLLIVGLILGLSGSAFAAFRVVETPPYHLYSGESGTATSIRITPYPVDLDGVKLTMTDFGTSPTITVDPGVKSGNSTLEEIESFTGITDNGDNTATLTGLSRDLASKYPYTTTGTGKTHGSGATVVFGNNPQIYGRLAAPENTQTWTATQTFTSTTYPGFDVDPGASYYTLGPNTTFVDYAQLVRTALAGTVNATPSINGVVQVATALQAASTTQLCSTGAYCTLTSSIATSSNDVAGLHVVVTQNSGKINWNMIDLGTPFTVTALATFNTGGFIDNASSTFTIAPIVSTIKSSLLKTSSTGQLQAATPGIDYIAGQYATSTAISTSTTGTGTAPGYATSTAITIPAGLLTASSTIEINGVSGGCTVSNYFSGSPACNVFLSLSTGQQMIELTSQSGGNNVSIPGSTFFTKIYNNSSVSSQIYSAIGVCSSGAPTNGSCNYFAGGTSAINFANAITLDLVLQAGPGGTGTAAGSISGYSIIIRP